MCHRTRIIRNSLMLNASCRCRWWIALVPGCCSCQIRVTCRPRSAVGAVDLLAMQFHFVQLQFFARTEVIETPVIIRKSFCDNNREIIFHYLFFIVFFIGFSYYTYRSQKNFLFFFLIICDLTRREFLIHAKWPKLSLCESCRYRRLTSFFFLLSVSRRRRTCFRCHTRWSTPRSTVRI